MSRYFAGVDVGSVWAKAVVVDESGDPRGHSCLPTGLDLAQAGAQSLESACAAAGASPSDLASIVSTGYGRDEVPGTGKTRSEILCLAKGAFHSLSRAMTVVDIGGQDSKIVVLDEAGRRVDYRMNRRCAAGTGSFLEVVCLRLGLAVEQLGPLAERTHEAAALNSFCSVFAATEVLDLLRRGQSLEAIARGVYLSVAHRIVEMGLSGPFVAMAGGVVEHHPILIELVRELTGHETQALPRAQHVGAFGAALLAMEGEEAKEVR